TAATASSTPETSRGRRRSRRRRRAATTARRQPALPKIPGPRRRSVPADTLDTQRPGRRGAATGATEDPMIRRSLVVAALLAALAGPLAAAPKTLKLATLVPEGSVWDKELRAMAAEVEKRTQGRVELRIYPGGVAGDEPDVVRKMRIGQLHAASLTLSGL